jgi:hypothetical protein
VGNAKCGLGGAQSCRSLLRAALFADRVDPLEFPRGSTLSETKVRTGPACGEQVPTTFIETSRTISGTQQSTSINQRSARSNHGYQLWVVD